MTQEQDDVAADYDGEAQFTQRRIERTVDGLVELLTDLRPKLSTMSLADAADVGRGISLRSLTLARDLVEMTMSRVLAKTIREKVARGEGGSP